MKSEKELTQHSEFKLSDSENLAWNIVDGETYQTIIRNVFEKVSERISFTFGPYGNRTTLDAAGSTIMTKDGFNVLKNISYNNPIYNSVVRLLLSACGPVVTSVGDGSSTCTIGAYHIYKHLSNSEKLKELRGKDLMEDIEIAVGKIGSRILANSTKINEDGDLSEIRKIAYVSTDSNDEFADMIYDIYIKTKNPTIEYVQGKSSKTTYEIIDGFLGHGVYLDRLYMTSDDERCVIQNPYILTFNYKIDKNDYMAYIEPAIRKAVNDGRRLVVYSPYYDTLLLESIRKQANVEYNSRGTTQVVYCRVPIAASEMNDNYRDFSMMCGCEMITEAMLEDYVDMRTDKEKEEQGKKELADPIDLIGSVETITINGEKTVITGFTNRKETMYNIYLDEAKADYDKTREDNLASGIVTNALFASKKRLARLKGSIGIIKVGGRNIMEKNSNYDAIEDAVKACESAFMYGYNIGCSLIIPIICNELKKEIDDEYLIEVLDCLSDAMQDVYREILIKYFDKDDDEEKIREIISTSITSSLVYDLINKRYSSDIINPCRTDIEVLTAATSLSSVLLSSNQYLALMPKEEVY